MLQKMGRQDLIQLTGILMRLFRRQIKLEVMSIKKKEKS